MKKNVLLLLTLALSYGLHAQVNTLDAKSKERDAAAAAVEQAKENLAKLEAEVAALKPPVYWTKKQSVGFSLTSLALTNWVAGGVNSNAISTFGNVFRQYKKDKIQWINNLDLAYGLIQNAGEEIRKNEDRIDLISTFGYAISPKVNYSSIINFKSQFAEGFDFAVDADSNGNRTPISRFMAPGVIVVSTGFDYAVTDFLTVYVSPATGKFTFVNDDKIAAQRTYIPADKDEDGNFYYKENFRPEFGASFKATLQKDLTKKINLKSTLDLFNNLTDANKANRLNTDVDWIVDLNMQLNTFLNTRLFTYLKYDDNQVLAAEAALGNGPKMQLQRIFGVGLNYKF